MLRNDLLRNLQVTVPNLELFSSIPMQKQGNFIILQIGFGFRP